MQGSLDRLGVDCIDLFYQHRIDRTVPIEETWSELKARQPSLQLASLLMQIPRLNETGWAETWHGLYSMPNHGQNTYEGTEQRQGQTATTIQATWEVVK